MQKQNQATTALSGPNSPEREALLAEASALLQAGELDRAAEMCGSHLRAHPDDARIANILGQILFRQNDPAAALDHLARAYNLEPESPRYGHDYALALTECGRIEEAVAILKKLTAAHPQQAESHFLLGNCYSLTDRHEAAAGRFQAALRVRPDYQEAIFNLGITLRKMGRKEEAAALFNKLITMPGGDNADNHFQVGLCLQAQAKHGEAVPHYRRALELNPSHGDTCYNLGIALRESGKADEAAKVLEKAGDLPGTTVKPAVIECNIGLALQEAERYQEAIPHFRRATELDPGYAEAFSDWGSTMLAMGRPGDAVNMYRKAVTLRPDFHEAWYNMGIAFLELLELGKAAEHYRRAIELKPDLAEAHWNLAIVLLLAGKYKEGFKEYLWRWRRKKADIYPIDRPEWHGETDPDMTLLVHAEQGLGDAIQFVRYLKLVKERVGRVFLACPSPLHRLFQSLPWADAVFLKDKPEKIAPLVDAHVPLLNLPTIFETTLERIPAPIPYLHAEEDSIRSTEKIFSSQKRPRIGIVWRGNPGHAKDRERSCRLSDLAPILEIETADFYSLQKDHDEELPERITDLAPRLETFADTAAILQHLDLLVTVDTSVAHLAGAMGRPVWVMLPFVPDWRWLTDRDDTPWYPSMRLFRQDETRRWEPVIERIRGGIARLAQTR